MTLAVITALHGSWEAEIVATLGGTSGYVVSRRCADLAELLAAAAAGIGDIALVSADLRGVDRAALHHLETHGVAVAGVVAPGDEPGERELRQLGLTVVVRADVLTHDLEDALEVLATHLEAPGAESPERQASAGGPVDSSSRAGVDARVIAVWGPTGAPGRSTVALNLAAELAHSAPTILVDCDTYGSSTAQALALLDEAPGMAAAARAADHGKLDLMALARVAPEVGPDLRVLSGVPRPERWTELRAPSVSHVLAMARRLCRFVVVDCGFSLEDDEELSYDTVAPRRNAATLSSLEAADDLVVVGSADPVGLQRLVRGVQDLAEVTSPASRRVVVNRVRASAVGSHPERRIGEALGRFAGLEAVTYLPWDPETLDGAMLAGRSLSEFAPHSDLRRAIAGLAEQYAHRAQGGDGGRRSRRRKARVRTRPPFRS
ncbi:AAA family ATPase [Pedococcus sp. 5OH_020]|uniref:AAA family ATPase n=1 Tax=Pedococcus sp. 5OH_020 TaxID=2989814 RepID=UPI0022E997D0|nr:hypothetical protein [Pedococcus sp. 5OH_020]